MPQTEETSGAEGVNSTTGDTTSENNGETTTPEENQNESAEKTFTQDEVNQIVAKQKRNDNEKIQKYKEAGLSEEDINLLSTKESASNAETELGAVQKERMELRMEKNSDLLEFISDEQKALLLESTPEKADEFFSGLRTMRDNISEKKDPKESGNMPSMDDGKQEAAVPDDIRGYAEGITEGVKTGDFSKAVAHVLKDTL